jgi:hypothetical protein
MVEGYVPVHYDQSIHEKKRPKRRTRTAPSLSCCWTVRRSLSTAVQGINHFSEMTGWYNAATPLRELRGFFRDRRGTFTSLVVPNSPLTEATGLNNLSQVVGDYFDSSTNQFRGFLWEKGVFSTIDAPFPGVQLTALNDINDHGDIVGF